MAIFARLGCISGDDSGGLPQVAALVRSSDAPLGPALRQVSGEADDFAQVVSVKTGQLVATTPQVALRGHARSPHFSDLRFSSFVPPLPRSHTTAVCR